MGAAELCAAAVAALTGLNGRDVVTPLSAANALKSAAVLPRMAWSLVKHLAYKMPFNVDVGPNIGDKIRTPCLKVKSEISKNLDKLKKISYSAATSASNDWDSAEIVEGTKSSIPFSGGNHCLSEGSDAAAACHRRLAPTFNSSSQALVLSRERSPSVVCNMCKLAPRALRAINSLS